MPIHYKMPVARNRYTGPTNDKTEALRSAGVAALYANDAFVDEERVGL
jgi:hypothetical protein